MIWAKMLTPRQIKAVKARDKTDKDMYIAAINSQKSKIRRIWSALDNFFKKLCR